MQDHQFMFFQFKKKGIKSIKEGNDKVFVCIVDKTRKTYLTTQKGEQKLQNQIHLSMSNELIAPISSMIDRLKQNDDFCSNLN